LRREGKKPIAKDFQGEKTMSQALYQVTITMSPETLQALLTGNFHLYGFKAALASPGGAPLVWFQMQEFSTSTVVSWEAQYQAYISDSPIVPNEQIVVSFSTSIEPGQILEEGGVVDGGPPGAISILNDPSAELTGGISQRVNGGTAFNPTCAFSLFENNMESIAPLEKILLMFSVRNYSPGTVIMEAPSPGFLIDLSSSETCRVSFDVNSGWSGSGCSTQQIGQGTALVPLLIGPLDSSSQEAAVGDLESTRG
jgi:hypothetical protein